MTKPRPVPEKPDWLVPGTPVVLVTTYPLRHDSSGGYRPGRVPDVTKGTVAKVSPRTFTVTDSYLVFRIDTLDHRQSSTPRWLDPVRTRVIAADSDEGRTWGDSIMVTTEAQS